MHQLDAAPGQLGHVEIIVADRNSGERPQLGCQIEELRANGLANPYHPLGCRKKCMKLSIGYSLEGIDNGHVGMFLKAGQEVCRDIVIQNYFWLHGLF